MYKRLIILSLVCFVTSCGVKGDLYLPGEKPQHKKGVLKAPGTDEQGNQVTTDK